MMMMMILFVSDYQDFYLIIHNIDGTMLRADRTQTILSLLAQISGFHIIASIDHINAPLCKSLRMNNLRNHYVLTISIIDA